MVDNNVKLRYYSWLVFLLTLLAFNACEGEDEVVTANPVDQDFVDVKLAFSTESSNSADTRMTEANTLSNESTRKTDFVALGLDFLELVPFGVNDDTPPISGNSQRLKRNNLMLVKEALYNDEKNRVYTAMLTPAGTKSFLVYARPSKGGPDSSPTEKFTYGSTVSHGFDNDVADNNASSINFIPDLIGDDNNDYQKAVTAAENMAKHMTNVANTKYSDGTRYIYWRNQRGDVGQLYSDFTHDGYVFTVANAEAMKTQLNMIKGFGGLSADLKAALTTEVDKALKTSNYNTWSSYTSLSTMPDGMIAFKWLDTQQKFIVLTHENSKTYLNPEIADPDQLAYPAQLWFYANSKVTTSEEEDADLTSIFNPNKWSNVLNNSVFSESKGVINSLTNVVAINQPLKYGVSKLKMRIKSSKGQFTVNGTQPLTNSYILWKGLLLTHQHNAGYDFQPLEDGSYYMMYDNDVKKRNGQSSELSTSLSNDKANYLLVMPSLEHEKMYVIAELFNNTTNVTFTGYKGCVIPPQTYFYMVGELDPAQGSKPNGSPANGKMVFESYMFTNVDATIKDFEGAYNYVPDLTSPALVLGLEVNFNWEQTEPKSVWLN